jgi:hypothetical protein
MQVFSLTSPEPTPPRAQLSVEVKDQAVLLHRANWGGALKIAKLLSRRHGVALSQWTVREWVNGLPRDLDPLQLLHFQSPSKS